ncbi:hypothetical protein Pfo_024598 [Paulownia fortunei]|nr:hypothetical protein Pfo_024598 [Paulownia fortunei]
MGFWGVEVKPGKPVIHSWRKAKRVRITQATLGVGNATKKSLVQCVVGRKSPVFLCSLLPNEAESCYLNLEFEEVVDVTFSVIGPRSVHLTGYYVHHNQSSYLWSDTESYGIDIENTEMENSLHTKDDKYEDSFIDDSELPVPASSPTSCRRGLEDNDGILVLPGEANSENDRESKQIMKEVMLTGTLAESDAVNSNSTPEDGIMKQDFQSSDGIQKDLPVQTPNHEKTIVDADINIISDSHPNGSQPKKRTKKKKTLKKKSKSQGDGNFGTSMSDLAKKEEDAFMNDQEDANEMSLGTKTLSNGEEKLQCKSIRHYDELGSDRCTKKEVQRKEIAQEVVPLKVGGVNNALEDNAMETDVTQDLPISNDKDQIQVQNLPELSVNPKRKRKDQYEEDKIVVSENVDNIGVLREDESLMDMSDHIQSNPSIIVEDNVDLLVLPGEASSESGRESKKIKKEVILTETSAEGNAENSNNTLEGGMLNQEFELSDEMEKDLLSDTLNHDEPVVDADSNIISGSLSNDSQGKKRTSKNKKNSKKKRKSQVDGNSGTRMCDLVENEEIASMNDQEDAKGMPLEAKTLSDGLVMEDLAKGDPNAKVAAPGRKVKVHFTGMLKENGYIFESSVGKTPCKFRLGDEQVIDGFNMGIDGMRVGDKRRLIIPPSMGFGEHGHGEIVPPNSWLVYDVELVGVRR